jgi:hypothetical protein
MAGDNFPCQANGCEEGSGPVQLDAPGMPVSYGWVTGWMSLQPGSRVSFGAAETLGLARAFPGLSGQQPCHGQVHRPPPSSHLLQCLMC